MSHSDAPKPVRLKQRRAVFENSKFRVYSDHITDDAGREVRDFLVVAPRVATRSLVTGVTVLPVCDNRILLLKTFRHAVEATVFETARGFIDANETPEQAALRELTEETGLICEPQRLVSLGTCLPEASTMAARIALFVALDCRRGTRTDEEEMGLGDLAEFSFAEAEAMLRDMQLEDVSTALSLHRFFLLMPAPPRAF